MEGVGDDVMQALSILFIFSIFFISLYYLYCRYRPRHGSIHEENMTLVNNVRTELSSNTNATTNNGQTSRTQVDPNAVCPICLASTTYPIETNCGHIYCGKCFTTYWRLGRWSSAVNCPSCRQRVTLLLFCFPQDSSDTSEERNEVVSSVNSYNRRFSGQPLSLYEYLQDLPTLLRHCISDFFTIGGLLWMVRFRIIVCLILSVLYILCPSDILPESVFGVLGILDDIFIALLLFVHITVLYRRFLVERET